MQTWRYNTKLYNTLVLYLHDENKPPALTKIRKDNS